MTKELLQDQFSHPPFREAEFGLRIRRNLALVRIHRPRGISKGGIYIERPTNWPDIWAHVISPPAPEYNHKLDLKFGDLVLYRKYSGVLIDQPEYIDYDTPGELADHILLHHDNILMNLGKEGPTMGMRI
jgi:co-chaperonin GroES (HSP10)